MESWRKVWREGLMPQLSIHGLQALRRGLIQNDRRITQGTTTTPPPMQCVLDWPIEAACVLGYAAWQGDGLETVGDVDDFFNRICFEAEQKLGETAVVRYFLNWYDEAPWEIVREELLEEVTRELAARVPECQPAGAPQEPEPVLEGATAA